MLVLTLVLYIVSILTDYKCDDTDSVILVLDLSILTDYKHDVSA